MSTARKLAALRKKQTADPAVAMSVPAMAGPTTRDRLNAEELSAMAFIRSDLPTSSTWNDWRGGVSNALTRAPREERAETQGTARGGNAVGAGVAWNAVRKPSASASRRRSDSSRMSARRLLTRSATTPPYRVNRSTGRAPSAVTRPTLNAELESTSASHPSATSCIQDPQRETNCPTMKSRKFRYRRAPNEAPGGGMAAT